MIVMCMKMKNKNHFEIVVNLMRVCAFFFFFFFGSQHL